MALLARRKQLELGTEIMINDRRNRGDKEVVQTVDEVQPCAQNQAGHGPSVQGGTKKETSSKKILSGSRFAPLLDFE